eukprot:gene16953-7010_t
MEKRIVWKREWQKADDATMIKIVKEAVRRCRGGISTQRKRDELRKCHNVRDAEMEMRSNGVGLHGDERKCTDIGFNAIMATWDERKRTDVGLNAIMATRDERKCTDIGLNAIMATWDSAWDEIKKDVARLVRKEIRPKRRKKPAWFRDDIEQMIQHRKELQQELQQADEDRWHSVKERFRE